METTNYYRKHLRSKLAFGGLVIAIGIVLLGLNAGFISHVWKPILFSWQMLLVLLGIVVLCCGGFFKGMALLLVGVFFLIPDLYRAYPETFGWASDDFVRIYSPVLLIAGGMMFIVYWLLPARYRRKHPYRDNVVCKVTCGWEGEDKSDAHTHTSSEKRNGSLNKNVIFAGCDEIYLDKVFVGGELGAVFGGISLDLRHTTLPEGETYLVIDAVFGGVTLYIPDTWYVDVRSDAIAGGLTDARRTDEGKIDRSRKLIIKGSFVFGGCEIK